MAVNRGTSHYYVISHPVAWHPAPPNSQLLAQKIGGDDIQEYLP